MDKKFYQKSIKERLETLKLQADTIFPLQVQGIQAFDRYAKKGFINNLRG